MRSIVKWTGAGRWGMGGRFFAGAAMVLGLCASIPWGGESVWAQSAMSLKGITLEDAPGEFTVIFWSDPPIKAYHHSFPRKPPRLAIDFPGKWKRPDKTTYRLENDTLKRITVDHYPDRLRATLHLKTDQIFEPFFYDSIKGLIVTIKKAHLFTGSLPKGVKVTAAEDDEDKGAAPAASRKSAAGELTDLSVSDLPEGCRLTLSLNRETAGYSTFTIPDESPPKLVLDLEGKWQNPGKTVRRVQSDSVLRVRVGEHPDYLRVVMDLNFDGEPTVEATAEGRTLVLEVRRPSRSP